MNDIPIPERVRLLLDRISKAEGHWTKQPRWPKGLTIGGQFKEYDSDGIVMPPKIGGGKSNPQYQDKADSLYKMFKSGELKLVQAAQAQIAEKAAKIEAKPKKSSHDNWNLSVHEYGKELLAQQQAKTSAEQSAFKISGALSLSQMTQTGSKPGGSNPGGTYTYQSKSYIVKGNAQLVHGNVTKQQSDDRAKNEILAAKLLQAGGVVAPEMMLVDLGDKHGGGLGVASEIITGVTGFDKNNKNHITAAQQDFAVHAWLANYDAVGMGFDNLVMTKDGKAANIDPGGAILFRAQGLPKKPLSDAVTEFDSMRNASINPQAAAVYGSMTQSQLQASVNKISTISNDFIKGMVAIYGPGTAADTAALANKLIARRDWLVAHVGAMSSKPAMTMHEMGAAAANAGLPPSPMMNPDFKTPGATLKDFNDYASGYQSAAGAALLQSAKDHTATPAVTVSATSSVKETTTSYVLTNTTEGHNKFYKLTVDGSNLIKEWGKIGTAGQKLTVNYNSHASAVLAAAAIAAEKQGKGYKTQASAPAEAVPKYNVGTNGAISGNGPGGFTAFINGKSIGLFPSMNDARDAVQGHPSYKGATQAPEGIPKGSVKADTLGNKGDVIQVWSHSATNTHYVAINGQPVYGGTDPAAFASPGAALNYGIDASDNGKATSGGNTWVHSGEDPMFSGSPSLTMDGPNGLFYVAVTDSGKFEAGFAPHDLSEPNYIQTADAARALAHLDGLGISAKDMPTSQQLSSLLAANGAPAPVGQSTGKIIGYRADIPAAPKTGSPKNPNVALAAKVANIAAYAQDVLSGKISPTAGVQAITAMQITGSNNYAVNAKAWQAKVTEAINSAAPKYEKVVENPYKPGTLSSALHEATTAATTVIPKPTFHDSGFGQAFKFYTDHAEKLQALHSAGDLSGIKAYMSANGSAKYEGNIGKPGTPNGTMLNDYAAKLQADLEIKTAKVIVAGIQEAQKQLDIPVANPPKSGEKAGNGPSMPDFEKAKLHSSNSNASSHNGKIEQIQKLAMKGDAKGIIALKFGTNNYAKKQVQVANNVLAALGYQIQVVPGQKSNAHPALTGGIPSAAAMAAMKTAGVKTQSASPNAGPVDNKGKPIVITATTFDKPPNFFNWEGKGSGLSSKAWANQQNQDIVNALYQSAQSLDDKSVKDIVFEKLTAEGKSTGVYAPLSEHPSKHIKEYQMSLLASIDDLKNPPEPLKYFSGSSAASLNDIVKRFPAKPHGSTAHTVKKNEQFGFWIALGKVSGAEKFATKKTTNLSSSMVAQGFEKYKKANSLVKKFISGMQSNVTTFSAAYTDAAKHSYEGADPKDIAKETTKYATAHPAGTAIYKWINFPSHMLKQIETAEVGLVFDSVKPMCCSYHPTATSGFGTHLLKIVFAEGAKGVDTFGSGHYSGEKEVSTLPHNRFMITEKVWTGKRWDITVLMLPPDPEVYK